MDSEDEFELLPSSPVHGLKLKRLKKAIRVSERSRPRSPVGDPSTSPTNSYELENLHFDSPNGGDFEESTGRSELQIEKFGDGYGLSIKFDSFKNVKEDGFGAMSVLDFDSVGEGNDRHGEACSMEKGKEAEDLKTNEPERKRRSSDSSAEKKKKKRIDGDGGEKTYKESTVDKRKAEKKRRDNLKELRAESQRLLRETRDAAFKPVPLVQKPISSILDKIRQRKLDMLKKSGICFYDNNGFLENNDSERACLLEEIDKVEKTELGETLTCLAATKNNLNPSNIGGSNDAADCEIIPPPMVMGPEPEHTFRAPVDDTQELFTDSLSSGTKDKAVYENSEDVSAPSMLAMNLKLDSVPPDDLSSDKEDNDKENIDPHLNGSANLPSPPSGDPVKAFVDEEAEEEDDSDNDLLRFKDNEDEDEDDDDVDELNKMIATDYEEKSIDRERRDQLHQQWLEQQDTVGMDNLLQKLNCGSKLRESTSIKEEDEESKEIENESDDEAAEYIVPSDTVKINLKKVKQMIPQMFTDKEDAYVSSDDEETEKRLAKQCLLDKAEEQVTFLSPAEDESSRGVFSLIKKLNIVPDTKRKVRAPFLEMPLTVQKINLSSKSSFVGRASNHFMGSSQKHGSSRVRSFIFGRDDSNSRTSMSEGSSDNVKSRKDSQPAKAVSAKFPRNTENKYTTTNSASEKSGVSLLEILRRSSLHAGHCIQSAKVQQKESSVFDAFKLSKKPIKTEGSV